jgi:NADH-quinone oxidoreductase subunit L
VIHALHGEQDIRNMGGLKKHLPITYWTFLVGSIAIAGVPPLAGFFSKDEILFETFYHGHQWLWVVGVITSLLTATYMFRLVFLTFHGEAGGAKVPMVRRVPTHVHGATATLRRAPGTRTAPVHPAHPCAPGGVHLHAPRPPWPPRSLSWRSARCRGFLGMPHALGGHNQLWLEPAFAGTLGARWGELAGRGIQNCAPGQEPALASLTQDAGREPAPALAEASMRRKAGDGDETVSSSR